VTSTPPVSPQAKDKARLQRKRRQRLRGFLWRWHRRLGLAAAVLVLVLSVTGIMLNHTESLELDETPLRNSWLLSVYGVEPPVIISFAMDSQFISHLGGDYLYLDDQELAYCRGLFAGVVSITGIWVAGCGDELILLTGDGEIIERIGAVYQFPTALTRIGRCGESLCFEAGAQRFFADVDQLAWRPVGEGLSQWSQAVALPSKLERSLVDQFQGQAISWERVLLDLHSGRILSGFGVAVMDLAALGLLWLSISGFTLWYQGKRR
jgi:hypothetical protein